jgi:bifunctional ADP-heptose synthase (sugar kinase/adenylyltransferase)
MKHGQNRLGLCKKREKHEKSFAGVAYALRQAYHYVVDGTGAGDMFGDKFCLYACDRDNLTHSACVANATAAICVGGLAHEQVR